MDINGVLSYFKSDLNVSTLYVFSSQGDLFNDGMGLGVLADESEHSSSTFDTLEHDCILRSNGLLSVVMLNTAPLYVKHYVASRGQVIFERHKGSHINFAKRAIDEYTSVADVGSEYELDRTFESEMEHYSDEQYFS